MRMRLQIRLAGSFSTKSFFFLKWNFLWKCFSILRVLPVNITCGLGRVCGPSTPPGTKLPNMDIHLLWGRVWVPYQVHHAFLHWKLCLPSHMYLFFLLCSFSFLQSTLFFFSHRTDILFSVQCCFQHLAIEWAKEKWIRREEITDLTSVAWPETSKCFPRLNRLFQKTAGLQVSIYITILRVGHKSAVAMKSNQPGVPRQNNQSARDQPLSISLRSWKLVGGINWSKIQK